MTISDDELIKIRNVARQLCVTARSNPIASVIMSSRDYMKPHWLTCHTDPTHHPYARRYVVTGKHWDKIYIFIPHTIHGVQHCQWVCSTSVFEIARLLLTHSTDGQQRQIPQVQNQNEFVSGFATRAVKDRGFVASRVRQTLLGLEYICEHIFGKPSCFLKDKIQPLLHDYLGPQDRINNESCEERNAR